MYLNIDSIKHSLALGGELAFPAWRLQVYSDQRVGQKSLGFSTCLTVFDFPRLC